MFGKNDKPSPAVLTRKDIGKVHKSRPGRPGEGDPNRVPVKGRPKRDSA